MRAIEVLGNVRFKGLTDQTNVSAIVFWNKSILIVTDEIVKDVGNVVQVLRPKGENYQVIPGGNIPLDPSGSAEKKEMDLEGLAIAGSTVFVLGSHSQIRKKVDPDKDYEKNRDTFLKKIKQDNDRDRLIRFELNERGAAENISITSLRDFFNSSELFKSFASLPGKENGVDLEGISIWRESIYIGCRGPVLRGNFVPILKIALGHPLQNPDILFVNLGGLGVRDLAHTDEGILILAGPNGSGSGRHELFLWNGMDAVPGVGSPVDKKTFSLIPLGELPKPTKDSGEVIKSAKAEGLAVDLQNSSKSFWEILVVFEDAPNGHAVRMRVKIPKKLKGLTPRS